jgi:hypothetical protein
MMLLCIQVGRLTGSIQHLVQATGDAVIATVGYPPTDPPIHAPVNACPTHTD